MLLRLSVNDHVLCTPLHYLKKACINTLYMYMYYSSTRTLLHFVFDQEKERKKEATKEQGVGF